MGSKDLERKRDCCYPPPADLDRDQDQQDKKDVNRDREDVSLFSSPSSSPCRVPHGQACGMPGALLGLHPGAHSGEGQSRGEKGRMLGVSATPEREARGITYSDSRPGWSSSPQTKKSDQQNLRGPRDSLTWRNFPPSSRAMACQHHSLCAGERAQHGSRPMAWGQRELGRGRGDDTQGQGTGRASILSPGTGGVSKALQLHTSFQRGS